MMDDTDGIVIVDLDGTLADSTERLMEVGFRPGLPASEWPTDWGDCMKDKPIPVVIELVNNLYENYEIWIMTIRSKESNTESWLEKHNVCYDALKFLDGTGMEGLHPVQRKVAYVLSLPAETRSRIRFCLEDSPAMIEAFRKIGITCFDVGPFYGSM
jgi:FMN phosphatase YigB (HAD superfamily)